MNSPMNTLENIRIARPGQGAIDHVADMLQACMADVSLSRWQGQSWDPHWYKQMHTLVYSHLTAFEGQQLFAEADRLLRALHLPHRAEGVCGARNMNLLRNHRWYPVLHVIRDVLNDRLNRQFGVSNLTLGTPREAYTGGHPPRGPVGQAPADTRLSPMVRGSTPEHLLDTDAPRQTPSASASAPQWPSRTDMSRGVAQRRTAPLPPPPPTPTWRRQNVLPQAAREFLQARTATRGPTLGQSADVPHYSDAQGAPRPLPQCVPRIDDALAYLAEQALQGAPGSIIEAEAFAFMYNLPAKLWRYDKHQGRCFEVQPALRQGDHSENYLSQPLNLALCDAGWGACDADGKPVTGLFKDKDGLYTALRSAADAAARPGIASAVPRDIVAIRADVAARLRGACAKSMVLQRERDAAVRIFRELKLPHPVHVTRHDPDTKTDYLAPDILPQATPALGLVHRGPLGWQVFLSTGREVLTDATIDSALLDLQAGSCTPLGEAFAKLLAMTNSSDDASLRRAREILAELAQPPMAPPLALSEYYTGWAEARLREDFAQWNKQLFSIERHAIDKKASDYEKRFPYQAFTSAEQERVVKNYLTYLGRAKVFGAEISIAGQSERLGRRIRVWTPGDTDTLSLDPAKVHGADTTSPPIDLYRVGAHYQYLDTEKLQNLGIGPEALCGRLLRHQLPNDVEAGVSFDDQLQQSGVVVDVGGDGNCQFLVIAYATNASHFATLQRAHDDQSLAVADIAKIFPDEPELEACDVRTAFTYARERVAHEVRSDLIAHWMGRLQAPSYSDAPATQKLVGALEEAAHNEAGEIIAKAGSTNRSNGWSAGIERQARTALEQRIAVLEAAMAFCPQSDDVLHAQGTQVLERFGHELSKRSCWSPLDYLPRLL